MAPQDKTYRCDICYNVNHVVRVHCKACGTIPARYSWNGKTIQQREHTIVATVPHETISSTIEIVVARGADRVEWHRTSRSYLRTVPADYYATE